MSKKVIFEKKNILVAGGAGFIGSHLCDELIGGAKVICIDNFSSGSERNIDHLLSNPDFVFINHDINLPIDLASLPELQKFKVQFQGIQEIYNLSCPTSPKHFDENRLASLAVNSIGVKNLLDLAVYYEAKFLQFSSSVIYGLRNENDPSLQVVEEYIGAVDPISPRSSYDEGKRFSESLVQNYHDVYNVDAKIIRVFRTYGPRMPLGDDQMIPDFINCALDGQDLVIYGKETFASSFCYVSDVVDAAIKVMKGGNFGPYNIGSDVDSSFKSIAEIIIKETASKSIIRFEEGKLFMSELLLPNIKKIRNEMSWMPVVTLENGLKKTIFDLQAQKQLQRFH
ncbi:MAG: NAD-dependent epimerase/dehydratase family protein [Patescibacteria group bacterium]